jgi:AcrR family transcriptional regulator
MLLSVVNDKNVEQTLGALLMQQDDEEELSGLNAWRAQLQKESHRAILAAAYEQLKTYGFQATSMMDIAKNAPASTATIYKHFSSKQMLAAGVIEEFFAPEPQIPFDPKKGRRDQAFAFLNAMVLADARLLLHELSDQNYDGPAMNIFQSWLDIAGKSSSAL